MIQTALQRDILKYEEALGNPYFGRVDFWERFGFEEKIYIGKIGLTNTSKNEEVVVDWRAPVAELYYSGTGGDAYYQAPSGIIEGQLSLKRKFLFNNYGDIEDIFDDGLNEIMINGGDCTELVDEFLKFNLEESRGKKLKEVVATIQKEQNEIIIWPRNLPIIVQGSAGSGKTTIALHRLAYLIYKYRESMKGDEILVLAPNKLFLDYISDILPSLGADKVKQSTFEELVKNKSKVKGNIYTKDDKLKDVMEEENLEKRELIINSAKLKGSLEFKKILDKYLFMMDTSTIGIEDIKVNEYVLFNKEEIIRLYSNDLKYVSVNKRKDEIKRYLGLKTKEKINDLLSSIDREWEFKIKNIKSDNKNIEERRILLIKEYDKRDEIKNNILKNAKKEFNSYFKNWNSIEVRDIYYNFYENKKVFSDMMCEVIDTKIANFMREEFLSNSSKNIIDEDDLAPMLYFRNLLDGIEENEKFKHIVVDEAQDYSPFQIYLINSFSISNSLTLVGDLAQGIYYYKGLRSWEDITSDLFKGDATYIQLTQSYRSTVEIIDFAKGALECQNLGLKNAKPVLRHGDLPIIIDVEDEKEIYKYIDKIIDKTTELGKVSLAIITKNLKEAQNVEEILKKNSKHDFHIINGKENNFSNDNIIIPSYLTKGLEFDCTIIYDPNKINYQKNILDERLLYVSLTRALHYEYILKIRNLTELIY